MTGEGAPAGPPASSPSPRSASTLILLGGLILAMIAVLLALGTWQVQRRSWKLDLIARVQRRVHAPPVAAPGPPVWPSLTREADEYRRVRATGVFLNGKTALVQASTDLGPGFWVMTPLRTPDGFIVLVNRGFVPPDRSAYPARATGEISGRTTVTGLLRLSEPKGGFLRHNAPAQDRWYSRDVTAIAAARGLSETAPYFIDADATPNPGGYPVGGLTVIAFPNSHLIYAVTWYGLALMLAGGAAYAAREEWRLRHA